MTKNTWNHCLKFSLPFIFCHICYGKSEVNFFIMLIKVKLLVSKASHHGFLSNALTFSLLVKIPNNFTQFWRKLRKFTGRLNSKISVACTSSRSCQQITLNFSSRTHRISTRLHMEDHKILLSSFIVSFHILTVLVLWKISSNGHVTVTSCFLGGMTNYNWPFGTLPFGLFWSNLDTRDLETYPRTYSGHFWNMSLFGDSRAVWVLFRKWVVSENQSFLDEGVIITPPDWFSFRRRGP